MYKEWLLWHRIKSKYRINYKAVVLVLAAENKRLDKACLDHLGDYVHRKYADRAIVFYPEECYAEGDIVAEHGFEVKLCLLSQATIERLYSFYCFMKFFDNIVFTYTDKPSDNLLQRYLTETDINEEDAACLALYHLRHVPKLEHSGEKVHV